MPSARTHDAITFLLAAPTFAAAYGITRDAWTGAVVALAFIFGGLMFGPDLDTVSRQYSRWSLLRFFWIPYRRFFKHRSRFSHGLIVGALLRVVYFLGVLTLVVYLAAVIRALLTGESLTDPNDIVRVWQPIGEFIHRWFGDNFLLTVFVGLWLGAASHTFTDMADSFIKTGRIAKFL